MPLIEKISAENPDIHFDVRPADLISDVVEGQIDIGIRVGSQLSSTRFIARSVGKIKHAIVATPALIGGRRLKVVATTAYDEFLGSLNWPLGAAIAFVLLVANLAIMLGWNRMVEGRYKKTLG